MTGDDASRYRGASPPKKLVCTFGPETVVGIRATRDPEWCHIMISFEFCRAPPFKRDGCPVVCDLECRACENL